MSLEEYVSYPHRGIAIEAALGAVIARTGTRFLKKRLPPSFPELGSFAREVYGDAESLLANAAWLAYEPNALSFEDLQAEYRQVQAALEERYRTQHLPFPAKWAVESGTAFLLYVLVRARHPASVIEVGVGNGHSSYFILNALRLNGCGCLRSFDVVPEAGALLGDEERETWEFSLITRRRSTSSLAEHLARVPAADLCFHDAGHSYLAQYFDFARLWKKLTPTGVLVMDDVDASYAAIDFCQMVRKRPELLIDRRKTVGVLSSSAPDLSEAGRDAGKLESEPLSPLRKRVRSSAR